MTDLVLRRLPLWAAPATLVLCVAVLAVPASAAEPSDSDAPTTIPGETGATGEPADETTPAALPPPSAPRALAVFNNKLSAGVAGLAVFTDEGDSGSLDVSLSERLRWEFLRRGNTRMELNVDGRLAVDVLGKPRLEVGWSPVELTRVTRLGVTLERPRLSVLLGRYPVHAGGFRLVDGLQLLGRPRPEWTVGAWGGLSPDLWTTQPSLRFGGGPILAYERRWLQVSLVGEFLGTPAGLDRVAGLLRWRVAAAPGFETGGRLDLQMIGGETGVGLLDAAAHVIGRPHRNLRLKVRYAAYSSPRYLTSGQSDPLVRRFETRSVALGLQEDLPEGSLDPSLHHDANVNVRWQRTSRDDRIHPRLEADLRFRYHPLLSERYWRIAARGTLTGLKQRLAVTFDTTVFLLATGPRTELGTVVWVELGKRRRLALDGSVRVGLTGPPDELVVDVYADLFFQALVSRSWSVSAGVYFDTYVAKQGWESGVGGLGRVTWKLRLPERDAPRRSKAKKKKKKKKKTRGTRAPASS